MSTMAEWQLDNAPDLKKEFPRSPAAEIGGYVLLARIVDKCLAVLAETEGEYKYNCGLDQRFFEFTGIDAEELKQYIATGASDEEVGKWCRERDKKNSDDDILVWGYLQRNREPEDPESIAHFEKLRREVAPRYPYIRTWAQLLDAEEGRL